MNSQALVRVLVAGLGMNGMFLMSSAVASAADVYTATMVENRGLREPKKAKVTVTIEQFSTPEDTAKLEAAYKEGGSDGAIQLIRTMERGFVTVEGIRATRIHHVRVHEGQAGNTVIIVTENPLRFPDERPDARSAGALGIVQFDLNAQGMGRGTMAEVVSVSLKEDGSLEIQSFNQATIQLEDVSKVEP